MLASYDGVQTPFIDFRKVLESDSQNTSTIAFLLIYKLLSGFIIRINFKITIFCHQWIFL